MRRLLAVTSLTAILTLLRMMAGFLIAKVVAVYTGATGLAMLGQIQSLILIFNGVVNAPGGNAIVRYTAQYSNAGYSACAPWWRASMRWMLLMIVISIPAGIFLPEYISLGVFQTRKHAWLIQIIILLLPFSAASSLITSVINGEQNYRRYITLGAISVLFSTAIMLSMIKYYGVNGALLAATMQSGIIGLFMLLTSIRQPWFRFVYWWGKTGSKHKKKIAGYLLMTISSAVMAPLSLIGVRNIIAHQLGWDAVGQWQVVWKISEVYLSVITIALGTYYLPKLSMLKSVNEIQKEIKQTLIVVVPVICLLSSAIYLTRDYAITILFTKEFTQARDLFLIQLVGDVVKIISWVYAYPMIAKGATKWFVSTEIIFGCSFIIFSFIFVSMYSLQGANIAYLVNYILYLAFVSLNLKRFAA